MSIVERIRKMWYGGSDIDVYDSDDFDGLWKMEEQEGLQSGRSLKPSHKKDKDIVYDQLKGNREITNVIQHPSLTPQSEVVVIEPRSFDEALEIVEELRCRRSVVLNLQYLDTEQSQRVVDFLSGATHALDGHQQRVGQGVFIFAPNNFTINTESNESRALKDAFWGRRVEAEKEQQLQYAAEPAKKSSIF
ncbi:MAG: cell division protein SepF [Candidatus Melainabacteria bacterium]|nr:cell division protein SepF [Candidatus Melainabacteria bacterium]